MEEEEDAKPMARCEEKMKGLAKHWQCGMEVQKSREQALETCGTKKIGGGLAKAPRK